MTHTVTLELPDQFELTIGGESVVLPSADIADSSYMAMLLTGRRKCNDLFNSQHNSYKASSGKDWLPSEAVAARDAIVAKLRSGDWGRDATPADPVGAMAQRLAIGLIESKMREAAVALGFDPVKVQTARMHTLRDHHRKLAAKLLTVGEWSGKNGNTLTWKDSALADMITKHDLRAQAEAEIAKTAENAAEVDVDALLDF